MEEGEGVSGEEKLTQWMFAVCVSAEIVCVRAVVELDLLVSVFLKIE